MKTLSVDTTVSQLMDEVAKLRTLLFIHQQYAGDDYPDEWMEEWQAFVDQQQDRQAFMTMIEDNILELPRNFRKRYRKWADADRACGP